MERKSHILFTITGIYGTSLILRHFWIDNTLSNWFVMTVASFPIISIPFMILATTLPDSDGNTRLKRTILAPAVLIINLITSHRWATHDIRWIAIVAAALYFLYLLWTNIVVLALISFFAVTITMVMIDDVRPKFLWLKFNILPPKIIEGTLIAIILIFFPILLIPEIYSAFLVSIFFAYVWHMFGDMPSREWWTPFITNKLKIQLPYLMSFKVGGFVERKIIQPLLMIALILVFWHDRNTFLELLQSNLSDLWKQYSILAQNPEILFQDLNNFNDRVDNIFQSIQKVVSFIQSGKIG